MTNSDQIKGKWLEIKGKVKQQWAKLTDDDMENMSSKVDELAGKIQQHYGTSKEEAHNAIRDFEAKL